MADRGDLRRRAFCSESPEATEALGEQLGAAAFPGLVVVLEGDLGTGKTTLVRGLARGLGIGARVTSPTFTLMNDYREEGCLSLHHFDAWMEGRERAFLADGGAEEIGAGGVCAVEWGERVEEDLEGPRLHVHFAHRTPERRLVRLEVVGEGPRAEALASLLARLAPPPGLVEEAW